MCDGGSCTLFGCCFQLFFQPVRKVLAAFELSACIRLCWTSVTQVSGLIPIRSGNETVQALFNPFCTKVGKGAMHGRTVARRGFAAIIFC